MDGTEGTCTQHYKVLHRNNEKEHQLYSVQQYIYIHTTSLKIVQVMYRHIIYPCIHLHVYMYTTASHIVQLMYMYIYIYMYTTSLHFVQVHV